MLRRDRSIQAASPPRARPREGPSGPAGGRRSLQPDPTISFRRKRMILPEPVRGISLTWCTTCGTL